MIGVLAAAALFGTASGRDSDKYSTNAICRESNCINPVFPGLEDLSRLESAQWQCQSLSAAKSYVKFCKNAVHYDFAVPSPKKGTTKTLEELVGAQDDAASTMYYYHLSGMGLEAWDYKDPDEDGDDCVKSVWRMVCNTYFPRAEAGCAAGKVSTFLRPCSNVCHNYIKACNVECCDESVQCVFSHEVSLLSGNKSIVKGYVDKSGPAAECTGDATRSAGGMATVVWLVSLLAMREGSGGL
eukprot:gnl/TRDRNA2_/TRDRNA2_84383_c0_seq1.p1 gnl/TRDRNA2_/TRDRNA2_84383_c0~~gnl/TRDRNA2_/TRDRNA2_84383_c0_seq1.p1  ORF type:complete len:279 (-),score=39.62 gnl/TRDRNA2_/TRDRNA2_84383_c0_seq1:62-784(-)